MFPSLSHVSSQVQLQDILTELLVQGDVVEVGVAQLYIRVAGGARQHPTQVQRDLIRSPKLTGSVGSFKVWWRKHAETIQPKYVENIGQL